MVKVMICKNLGLKPGARIKLVGVLSSYVKKFTIVMGKDEKNLAMYFSPQYSFLYGKHVIVCKNLHDGNWGMEKTEIYFPFTHGASVEIPIYFNGKFFMVTLPDGYPVGFSNCCETTMVDFLAVYGDIRITSLDFQ